MYRVSTCCGVILILGVPLARAQSAHLHVRLPDARTVTLTDSSLRELAGDTVRFAAHGGTGKLYRAVPLDAVLRAAGMPLDSLRVGHAAWTILAIAADGYVASFSAAEVDPKLGTTHAWLAISADGQPLPPDEGPFRLIVPTDAHGARSAFRLETIQILDALRPPPPRPPPHSGA